MKIYMINKVNICTEKKQNTDDNFTINNDKSLRKVKLHVGTATIGAPGLYGSFWVI